MSYTIWMRMYCRRPKGWGWGLWVPTIHRGLTKAEAEERMAAALAEEEEFFDDDEGVKVEMELREVCWDLSISEKQFFDGVKSAIDKIDYHNWECWNCRFVYDVQPTPHGHYLDCPSCGSDPVPF